MLLPEIRNHPLLRIEAPSTSVEGRFNFFSVHKEDAMAKGKGKHKLQIKGGPHMAHKGKKHGGKRRGKKGGRRKR